MPSKSGKAAHGRTSRRKRRVTRREPLTTTVTDQAAGMAVQVQAKKGLVLDVRSEEKQRNILTGDWRRTFIVGGILLIALIVVSLILRYTIEV